MDKLKFYSLIVVLGSLLVLFFAYIESLLNLPSELGIATGVLSAAIAIVTSMWIADKRKWNY